ncbi:MAG: glycosyltransferase family 8 protein [Nevskiales bacterium]
MAAATEAGLTQKPLHVACAADAAFIPHCAAMLHSVCAQHTAARVHVHFLHDDSLPAVLRLQLGDFVNGIGAQWQAWRIEPQQAAAFPDHPRFGRLAWYRVLLPELLPQLDRVLYLDADMIVADRLDAIWELDLGDHALAAVTNPLYPEMSTAFLGELGLPSIDNYFNSGMLLLNLTEWRRQNIVTAILKFVQDGVGLHTWPDQNALNAVLWRRRLALPPRWNALSVVFDLPPQLLPYRAEELVEARQNPAIIHFIGHYKPWHYRCKHPFRELYFRHLRQTPWRDLPLEGHTLYHRLMRLLPWLFGLRLENRMRAFWQRLRRTE